MGAILYTDKRRRQATTHVEGEGPHKRKKAVKVEEEDSYQEINDYVILSSSSPQWTSPVLPLRLEGFSLEAPNG